ncbi:hypothetical protein HIM_09890 [Hirsutella minnesotensis 3608]|uniref:Uncharacterized protein n=1 Tax=Hirsutella minnesotensis 3608 TaxID=1043627 RepID=A0A0F7ZGD6_9HYPO|nr:hypothetical protein HIM_09890 [Hirsutella minnesotensis 3608]
MGRSASPENHLESPKDKRPPRTHMQGRPSKTLRSLHRDTRSLACHRGRRSRFHMVRATREEGYGDESERNDTIFLRQIVALFRSPRFQYRSSGERHGHPPWNGSYNSIRSITRFSDGTFWPHLLTTPCMTWTSWMDRQLRPRHMSAKCKAVRHWHQSLPTSPCYAHRGRPARLFRSSDRNWWVVMTHSHPRRRLVLRQKPKQEGSKEQRPKLFAL